ncbi:EscI/YscI/HrpB family type III secretion system inner rod protein [Pandoraea iniqua]|uniref:EscI/YscI/HrpB family type III secretion system inner rod protein n=1 Tax=Pandoraea iniqua TaxID=2508288 RepID=A0A5E4T867_9BURK|nr:type III secretion system inner rod subunit SctI [Pandoraea iniqua]VVD84095.1 EscI/YscI/HrpB family type III secretion system inner rod protein [Pandoraea iniqua]
MSVDSIHESVQRITAINLPTSRPTLAEAGEAARFAEVLAHATPLPEHHLLNAAGKLAANTENLTTRVTIDERTLDDPQRLLQAQRDLTERVLSLELVAKVAGAATQGVNKLVHMQ